MASRIMHLAISYQLESIINPQSVNNFRIGHILPDAVIKADKKQVNTHFIKNLLIKGKPYKLFDYFGFYDRFKGLAAKDELYLGYYFHLIEDNIFRNYLYKDLGMLKYRGKEEFLQELYKDYGILNGILAEKYGISPNLEIPKNFTDCKINEIYNFELKAFLEELKYDFSAKSAEKPRIFTENSAEEYISRCVDICKREYEGLRQKGHFLSEDQLAFEINQ